MKKGPLIILFCLLGVQSVQAQETGGLKENVAPPPAHKIEDGYRGTDDARVMTVKFAKTMHDGATLSLRGNLIKHKGDDRYVFRDKTDTIDVIIPKAVFDGREVQPDQMISINGSLDKKLSPPVVRIDRLQK
ncbi:YdeI family stress tolerance OB fold protein [Scandinavium sp. V105_16]|uniref:YdeI family stress tolerance OB fold protein n=1 Tax=Scandinavium lactucae TaxID=3095028 RepID=A0AAJ2VUP7_9ENTR|nr:MULTISPECIES: YdeI family stress tolerance OB fold protein [unclassified Scandinavium]MDX6022098.1 YdeI family stress tolerance OB fold protein [Scandinavium sp. V105_16]MDX6034060.1 YdeI family stress tolerance OB fold protein [Scandinavium sp. V105_12]MDX6042097.1 YdeI family stress tolerance OB fold protein [Scandinavium sp. V105_6]MDX6052098.1 YdeI family stress tolerance OB fold protein [Scandinavium sp. V105_1]